MTLLYGHDVLVADFVARNIPGCGRGFTNCKAIGVLGEQGLIAGVVYHNWAPEAGVIEMSCAATDARWLNKRILHTIFAYPFEEVRCQMVVTRVSENNKRMVRIFRAMGFDEHLIPRLRGRGENEFIFTLTDDAWQSLPIFKRCRNG